MEADLKQRIADEEAAVAEFTKMRAAKRAEIKEQKDLLFATKEALARGQEALQNAKKAIKEALAQLEADRAFLKDVNERAAADKKVSVTRTKEARICGVCVVSCFS